MYTSTYQSPKNKFQDISIGQNPKDYFTYSPKVLTPKPKLSVE